MGNSDSQDSPRPGLGGNHHLPPYSILCGCPRGPHLNDILSWDSQVGVPKLPKLGFPRLWGAITLRVNLRLRWGLKQSCSLRQEFFNNMLHVIYTHGNRVDSWLLMVRSQIANLTPNLSFGYNLCFRCLNGQCEPILNIYVPRAFQWYKEFLKPLNFNPCNCLMKFQESIEIPFPKVGVPLRVWGCIPSHLPHSRTSSWPITL
jgi:hypothetical protein